MLIQTKKTDESRAVKISYENYRRWLAEAVELDRRHPWIRAHDFRVKVASISGDVVTLKMD